MEEAEKHASQAMVERRLTQISTKTTRSLILAVVLFLGGLVLAIVFMRQYVNAIDTRLTTMESSIRGLGSASTAANRAAAAVSSPELDAVKARLSALETLQEAMTNTSRGALEQMNFVFATVSAFFGLFSLFFAYRQIMADTNREGQDAEMRGLVSSFQSNITTINSLIMTLEKGFDYRKQIEAQLTEVRNQTRELEEHQGRSDSAFESLVAELNEEAVRLFDANIDRASLGIEETVRKLDTFARRMNSAETMRQIENSLNPFCYYIRGLSKNGTYQYALANRDFEIAHERGNADLAQPRLETYAAAHRVDISHRVSAMLVSCSYFQGIGYKNLGQYEQSRAKFQRALDRDPTHLKSRTYILQVLFFDAAIPFAEVERGYATAVADFKELENSRAVDRADIRKAFKILKVNEGNMYLKKLLPLDERTGYRQYENQDKALQCFWDAYDYLDDELAEFSVAQAMAGIGPSAWRTMTPEVLYAKAMTTLNNRVAEDHDQLYSVMLYYMLAICARRLGTASQGSSQDSSVFLAQARHCLRQVPTDVTCFSPINKIRLARPAILDEMQRFEAGA